MLESIKRKRVTKEVLVKPAKREKKTVSDSTLRFNFPFQLPTTHDDQPTASKLSGTSSTLVGNAVSSEK
jgi:hypothetical protein